MRRKAKKQIIDILDTLSRAQAYAVRLATEGSGRAEEVTGQTAEATDLLIQCQEGAQKIGETIEQSEGEGTEAVACLERYCEGLYQMSLRMAGQEQIRSDDKTSQGQHAPHDQQERHISRQQETGTASIVTVEALAAQMDQLLAQVRREVEEVLPTDKIKICFLPYKASMWDCMESVWEAAAADSECEAKVVPIPYYERDDQGWIAKGCYDGDLFPAYVPVTPYRSYDLSKEQPDIIYIHNPYDGGNTVTTVHPDYFASNLKKYTDMLVYIPYYFLGNGPLPDCHLSLPAYEHVDRIIVQDQEKVDALADFVPREKILAIGSPKVDRILKLERQKEELICKAIPAQWREKIRGKKVILYNISVTGILRNSRYLLDKLRYVLSCFAGREDVVLWWRPHPLLEATIKSAMPELYPSYLEIKDTFAESRNGILDESGDAGVAAVIADAYLGEDSSSLVHYFGVLGKPVMLTRWEIVEDRKDRGSLNVSTFYQEGEHLFFVPTNPGMELDLYRIGLEDGEIKKVTTFPGTPANMWGCYYGIKKVGDKIILPPYNVSDIYVYDLRKDRGIKLALSEAKGRTRFFIEAVVYKEKVFLLPGCYPAIVRVDPESLEIQEYKECVEPFLQEDETVQMFQWAFLTRGRYLYLAGMQESKMLIFDMEDGSYTIKAVGDHPYGYCRMLYDGEYFWLGAFGKNSVVRWDEESGDTREYAYPMEQEPTNEWIYYGSLYDRGDEILVFYASSFRCVAIDKKTGDHRPFQEITAVLDELEDMAVRDETGFAYAKQMGPGSAVLFDMGSDSLHLWDVEKDQWEHFPCRIPKEELLPMEKWQIEGAWLSRSTPYFLWEHAVQVPQYIDYILQGETKVFRQTYACYQDKTSDLTSGTRIHGTIKNVVTGEDHG